MDALVQKEISKQQVYATMMVLCLADLLAFAYFKHPYFLYAAIALLLIALFVYPLAKIIHRAWMKLAEVLSWVNTRILLGIIFFLILVPLAFLRKMMSKDNLPLEPGDEASYYVDTEGRKVDFERPW